MPPTALIAYSSDPVVWSDGGPTRRRTGTSCSSRSTGRARRFEDHESPGREAGATAEANELLGLHERDPDALTARSSSSSSPEAREVDIPDRLRVRQRRCPVRSLEPPDPESSWEQSTAPEYPLPRSGRCSAPGDPAESAYLLWLRRRTAIHLDGSCPGTRRTRALAGPAIGPLPAGQTWPQGVAHRRRTWAAPRRAERAR